MVCQNPRRKPGRPEVRGPKGDSAYEVWVKAQPPGSDVSLTAYFKAITGLSAYQDWVARQPAGTDTSFDAFMAAHKGQSAYQVWACYQPPGADTSLEAFMEYMKGKKGDNGQPGPGLVKATTTIEPVEGGTKVDIHLQVEGQDEEVKSFTVLNGEPGKDGTVADFDQNQFTTKVVDGKTVITIKNDPDSSNQLSVTGKDGLFVRPASAQVRAKDSSVRVDGIPQDENGGFNTEVSVNSIPVKNNQLGIRTVGSTEGLYVQSAHEELLSPNKTLSIKTSATEVPFEPVKTDIDVAISKEDGNSLVIKEDGLFSAGGGGGDLDSKYIKVGEAAEKPEAAVGGGDGTIVIGSGAGNGAMGPANKTTVVGALAKSLDDGGTVVGYNSSATGKQGIAIGFETSSQGDNTVSVGYQASASQRGGIGIGWNAQSLGDNAIVVGTNSQARGISAIAIGNGINTEAERVIVIGQNTSAIGYNSIVIGNDTKSVGGSVVIGLEAEGTGTNSVALGSGATSGAFSSAVGAASQAVGESAISVGYGSLASLKGAIAIGPRAQANHTGAIAIGQGSSTAADDEVSFGNGYKRRKLTNVSDGKNPYDAVNVGQLNTTLQNFTPTISSESGNAIVAKEDGLYAPKAPKLVRKASSGSISWNYQDTPNSENAAGKLGNGCYLKFPINFSYIKAGVTDFVPDVTLTRAPCNENGEIIPHQLYITLASANNNTTPKVQAALLMERIPTHTIDTTSLKITPVARVDNGLTVGIPEIPVVPEGGTTTGNGLGYRVGVMVNSTDLV